MNKQAVKEQITEYLHDRRVLRGLLALMVVVALILAAIIFKAPSTPSKNNAVPAYATYIHDHKSGMTWLVTVKPHSRNMVIKAMGNYKVPEGHNLKAWIKVKNGKAVYVGKFPSQYGRDTIKLPEQIANLLPHLRNKNPEFLVSMGTAGTKPQSPKGQVMWRTYIDHRINMQSNH